MGVDKKILFVDDEPLSVIGAMDFLQVAGYDTQYLSSGKKAWEVLNKNPKAFKAIVIDYSMPGINGGFLIDMIKNSPALNRIPLIVESDSEDAGSYLQALEVGAFDYLYKPLEEKFLLYVVDNAVNDVNNSEVTAG
jgi:CheY-like chemotaxis protein